MLGIILLIIGGLLLSGLLLVWSWTVNLAAFVFFCGMLFILWGAAIMEAQSEGDEQ